MKWKDSDEIERQGVALTDLIISKLGQIFRGQETNDVGIDAHVELVNTKTREATGQLLALQIKSGPSFLKEKTDNSYIFRGAYKHLDYWLNHALPVFLLLVDTDKQKVYWQEISQVIVERLEKGWKVAVPFANELTTNFAEAASQRVGLDANGFSYTRLALKDTSNVNAKRYTANILMRPPVTRMRAEAVIRRANADIRKDQYNLEGFKKIFGDRDADVVSLYVAGDLHDDKSSNWYCRTMWVSKDLAADVRPEKLGGVDLGGGLEVVWNADYATSSQFYHGHQMDKQAFLAAVKEFTASVEVTIAKAFGKGVKIVCDNTALHQHTVAVRELFIKSNDVGLPPYECNDVADRFGDIMAIADNAFIYAEKVLADSANGGWLVLLENELNNYWKNIERLEYELEKVK